MLEAVVDKIVFAEPSIEPRGAVPRATVASGALARKFVDLLLDEAGRASTSEAPSAAADSSLFEEFGLVDDSNADLEPVPTVTLSVENAAVAILLAACFEEDPATLRALRKDAPVIVVQAPDARSYRHVEEVLRICALGRSTSLLSTGSLERLAHSDPLTLDRRHAAILLCDMEKRDRSALDQRALTALSLAVPVCAVSVDIGRNVPEQLRAVADWILVPGSWNAALLTVLVEAVTGAPATVAEEGWIAKVTIDDLRMSVSRHRGAEASLERLRSTVLRRVSLHTDLPDITDLHGYGDAKRVAHEMLADLADYRDGKIAWSAMSRGLVLAGPTGTGKTFFVRCFARSAGLPLVIGSMAQWQATGDGHLGDCLGAMKRSFAEAKACAPSILFIDEIDSVGDRETFHPRHRDYSSQVVNGLLEELDGASDRTGVTVFAATNHPSRVDRAILRPGRLDRVVTIGLPDVTDLVGILRTQLGGDLPDADLVPVALAGRGGSGASVASWVRQARGTARRARRALEVSDLVAAVREGRVVLPETERRRIALHEAAHACAAVALDLGTVHGVSLHDTGGTTEVKHALRTTTRGEAVAAIVHLLAGRSAERHFLGAVSAGAGGPPTSDLALATRMAFAIEASWGLGEQGPVWLGEIDAEISTFSIVPGFSGSVRRLLRHCESEADRLVAANEMAIRRCADRLQVSGHLDANDVLAALGVIDRFEPAIDPLSTAVDPSAG